jgi:hypothetical protein
MGGWLRCDHGWGFAACGEVSATRDCVLKDALPQSGLGAGGGAFGEAGVDGGFGAGVCEKEMLDDLLDRPLAGGRSRAELGLSDVEPAKGRGDLALKLAEGGVHSGKKHVTPLATCQGKFFFSSFLRTRLIFVSLQFVERFFGILGLFSVRIQFEIGLVLGDSFIIFLHLLQDLGQGEVRCRVLGLDLNSIFGAEIGALVVLVMQIEL